MHKLLSAGLKHDSTCAPPAKCARPCQLRLSYRVCTHNLFPVMDPSLWLLQLEVAN